MRYHLLVPLAMLMAAVPIAILVSIYFRSRDRASPEAIAAVLLFTGVALVASFGIRAQVLDGGALPPFYSASIDATAGPMPPFQSSRFGPTSTPACSSRRRFCCCAWPVRRSPTDPRRAQEPRLAILALTLPAMLCTPLGWHLPAYAATLSVSPIRHYIEEWQPATFRDAEFLFGGLPLALLAAGGLLRDRHARYGARSCRSPRSSSRCCWR